MIGFKSPDPMNYDVIERAELEFRRALLAVEATCGEIATTSETGRSSKDPHLRHSIAMDSYVIEANTKIGRELALIFIALLRLEFGVDEIHFQYTPDPSPRRS
jgi:hypothetical protein